MVNEPSVFEPLKFCCSKERAYCACSRCGRKLFVYFFSQLSSLFFLPVSSRWPVYSPKYYLKGLLKPKQSTNQTLHVVSFIKMGVLPGKFHGLVKWTFCLKYQDIKIISKRDPLVKVVILSFEI